MPDGAPGAPPPPRIERIGDAALLLVLGDELDPTTNARARRIARDLAAGAGLPGLGAPVAGHASVLLPFDPDTAAEEAVRALLAASAADMEARPLPDGVLHELPVRYGGADGPDLAEVARRCGLSEAEVVELHVGVEYRVMVVGFVPGFPYLAGLPARLELPRRATPRVRVPAGSLGVAGRQCGIYPFETSGGWHLLGRATAPVWDPRRDPPALLAPGDRVRFVPA